MRILLDTHVFLWLQSAPTRLGHVLDVLADTRNDLLVSAASAWEIAIKHGTGRLPLPEAPARYVPSRMRAIGAVALPVEVPDALVVADLPPHHRDPFDRMLVAQALRHQLTLVTADDAVARYDIPMLRVP